MKDIALVGKKVIADKCKTIFSMDKFDESWTEHFKVMAGEWSLRDGCLIGKECGNKGGILLYNSYFEKNVMITFTASTVLPATRDVNAVFCANWDEDLNDLGDSYVCGLNGWYDNKIGLEKNLKGGKLGFRSLSSLYEYRAGQVVTLCAGAIDGHIFMTVDDKLVAEHIEYENYLTKGYVGISPFCTILKIKNIKISEIFCEKFKQEYTPEF